MRKSLLVVAMLSFAAPVAAQESDRPPDTPRVAPADSFRAPGRVVLDDVIAGGVGRPLGVTVGWFTLAASSQEANGVRSTSTLLSFAPSADVFVFEGVSLGGSIAIARQTTKSELAQTIEAGAVTSTGERATTTRMFTPRVGYAIRLSDDLLVWPRARVGWGTSDTSDGTTIVGTGVLGSPATPSSSGSMWTIGGDASLVYVLGRHAALAAGPDVTYAFQKQDDPHQTATSFDISFRGSLRLAF